MSLFGKAKRKINLLDEVRCDEPSFLIWKWRPAGGRVGETSRENAIRWGSSLRVKEGQAAILMCNYEEEAYYDSFEGPCDVIIETENIPVIASIVERIYGGGVPFPAEVYFVNLAELIQIKFGVPFFDVYDPFYPDFAVPVAVRGTIAFRIADYWEFIRLNGLRNFTPVEFQTQIRDAVCRYVKDIISNAPAEHNIPVVQIESKLSLLNDVIEYDIRARLSESFGVDVSAVDVSAIEIDKSCNSYRQLMGITRDATSAVAMAELDAKLKDIAAKQRITEENYAEELRIQREENQYAQRKQTQSANLAAFHIERQTAVEGANPWKPAPPPIPSCSYHLAISGQAVGPFEMAVLQQMASSGQLTRDTLVWKPGMSEWVKAGRVEELTGCFESVMPPIPNC